MFFPVDVQILVGAGAVGAAVRTLFDSGVSEWRCFDCSCAVSRHILQISQFAQGTCIDFVKQRQRPCIQDAAIAWVVVVVVTPTP